MLGTHLPQIGWRYLKAVTPESATPTTTDNSFIQRVVDLTNQQRVQKRVTTATGESEVSKHCPSS